MTFTPIDSAALELLAASLNDLEKVRIASENRLRQITRDEPDADGEYRGAALPADDPVVRSTAALVEALQAAEHQAELALKRALRVHPLGPWVKQAIGVGEKQGARLIAALRDPYLDLRFDPPRPRTVSQLWALAGLHVLPGGQHRSDTQVGSAAGDQFPAGHCVADTRHVRVGGDSDDPTGHTTGATRTALAGGDELGDTGDHVRRDVHDPIVPGVAARRRKGVKSNWSSTAKMRSYLVATSCIKQSRSPYRAVYDDRRAHTAVTHPDWTDGHSHNDGLRIVAKAVLKDLWRAARAVHGVADEEAA